MHIAPTVAHKAISSAQHGCCLLLPDIIGTLCPIVVGLIAQFQRRTTTCLLLLLLCSSNIIWTLGAVCVRCVCAGSQEGQQCRRHHPRRMVSKLAEETCGDQGTQQAGNHNKQQKSHRKRRAKRTNRTHPACIIPQVLPTYYRTRYSKICKA